MSLSSLEIAKRGLLAQRFGLDVTSNNIANVNTPGYSRRQAQLMETDPRIALGGFQGTGVIADKLRTFRDEFFDKEIRSSVSRKSGYESDEEILNRIEALIAEPSEEGFTEVVSKFFNSFEDLALKPEDVSLRQYTLGLAQSMVERFHTTSYQLSEARDEVLTSYNANIDKANTLIENITKLNVDISNAYAQNPTGLQTYIDQRELALEELSQLAGVSVTQTDFGMVNVFVNGLNIITGTVNSKLESEETVNSATGERTLRLMKVDANNNRTALSPQSGEMASQLKHYNTTLDAQDSSGGFSIAKKLDEFANAIVQNVNNISITGYGLDDTGATSPGRYFFEPTVGTATASTIELSADIKDNPRNIPLSSASNEPGNSDIARQIARLSTSKTFLNGQTPSEYFSGVIGKLAQLGQDAENGTSTTTLVTEQLSNQRESVIGVNLDEEAVNLIKFQKAFEASSRVVNMTNEILATIVNLGK